MTLTRIVGGAVAVLALSVGMLCAAPGAPNGPKAKLEAPANVTCPLTDDGVLVSWDAVVDANAYQVEFVCVNALGEFRDESVFAPAPPVLVDEDDCTVMAVHVRAMPAPKHANGPLQGSGPKGAWSETCLVEPVIPPVFQ